MGPVLDIVNLGQVLPVRKRISEATQRLLGDTIRLDDDQWAAPSLLPGWSRAHVATHLARDADALRGVMTAAFAGETRALYQSPESKFNDLERGAERTGLDLQVDLDTSAGRLETTFDQVEDWLTPIRLPEGEYPASVLPLVRLQEVELHHIDLDCGHTWEDLDLIPARWLLQWLCLLLREDETLPCVDIASDSGVTASFGATGARRQVTGTDAALWAWLTGRYDGASLSGAEGLTWPMAG